MANNFQGWQFHLQGLHNPDWRIRARSIDQLKGNTNSEILGPLTSLLNDHDPVVRIKAIEALGSFPDPRVVSALIEKFYDDDSGVVDVAVVTMKTLGKIAVDSLLPVLKNPALVNAASRALGEIGDRKATGAIIQAINEDQTGVIYAPINALGNLKDPGAVQTLINVLFNHKRGIDREAAAKALGNIRDVSAIPALVNMLFAKVDSAPENMVHSGSKLHPFNHQVVESLANIDFRFQNKTREEIQKIYDGMKQQGLIPSPPPTPAPPSIFPPQSYQEPPMQKVQPRQQPTFYTGASSPPSTVPPQAPAAPAIPASPEPALTFDITQTPQPANINQNIEIQLIGMLKSHNELDVEFAAQLLGLDTLSVKRMIYQLIGSGKIAGTFQSENVFVIQKN